MALIMIHDADAMIPSYTNHETLFSLIVKLRRYRIDDVSSSVS